MKLDHEFRCDTDQVGVNDPQTRGAGILVAMSLAWPKPARAAGLGVDIIALFPKEVGEFGTPT